MRPARGNVDKAKESITPSVNGLACLTVQRPGTPCTVCRDECPANVFVIQSRSIQIDLTACLNCGRCAAACPTGAIAAEDIEVATRQNAVEFECARVPDDLRRTGAAIVPCLGSLGINRILDVLCRDESSVTVLDRGWCASCPAGGVAEPWKAAQQAVSKLLERLDANGRAGIRIERAPLPIERAQPLKSMFQATPQFSRRQLFARLARPSTPASAPAIVTSHHTPLPVSTAHLEKRRQLLQSLSGAPTLSAAVFPSASISTTCCNSQVCAHSCPTKALTVWTQHNAAGIAFDAAACIDCGECERACPTHSISIRPSGEGVYEPHLILTRHLQATCQSCDSPFTPSGAAQVCPACGKDRELAAAGLSLMRHHRPRIAEPDDIFEPIPNTIARSKENEDAGS